MEKLSPPSSVTTNKRIVTVEASIDKSITTADEVHKLLGKDFYATTLASFPGLAFALPPEKSKSK